MNNAAWRPALEPTRLTQTAGSAVRVLLREGESANTRASYASTMRYWFAWLRRATAQSLALPVPVPVVIRFIVDHAARRAEANADMDAAVNADANSERNATLDHALESAATTNTGLRSTRRWWPTGTRQREAAARLAAELGVRASVDTVLRELRRSAVTIRSKDLPRIVGIDDWAIAMGHYFLATT